MAHCVLSRRRMTKVPRHVLARVVGGFGDGSDGWDDSMSNGAGGGHIHLPNGTWRQAAVDHDHRYCLGGTSADRKAADRQLCSDMVSQGAPRWVAQLYYSGVRVFGGRHWGKVPKNPGSH
jgi:hypothetical protein